MLFALIFDAFGAKPDTSADRSFADWLFANGRYDLALAEYFRIHYLSLVDNGDHHIFVEPDIARCYFMMGKIEDGIYWCESSADSLMSPALADLLLIHARLLMKAGRMTEARQVLLPADTIMTPAETGSVLFLRGCTYAWEWQHDDAIAQWRLIPLLSPLKEQANHYTLISAEAQKLDFLNPTKGSVLGIVPGAGYLYAGHRQTALAAAIVIGLTSWGTYASFDKGVPGLGYLTGLLTIGWYSGSIYGSYWACVRWNDSQQDRYLKEIQF